MKTVNKKRLKASLLTILLSLSVLVGNFAFYAETIKAADFEVRLIAQACEDGQPCESEKTDPTNKKPTKKPTKPAPKKTTDDKIAELEKAKEDTAAVYDNAIAEFNKQKAAATTKADKDKIEAQIKQATYKKEADLKKANTAIQTAKKKPFKAASAKAEKAKTTVKTQETKVATAKSDIKELEAEKLKALAEKGVNSKEYKALEKKIATKQKTLTAEEKKLSDAKAALSAAEADAKKYDPTKVPTDETSDTAPEEKIKGFHIPNPTSLDNFEVSKYLSAGDKHKSYINNEGKSGVFDFILATIDVLIKIIGSIALIILIIGGLILITSGGNEQQLDKGKEIIKFALIGLVIALSAFLIITFVNNFLSVGLPVQPSEQ